MKIDILFHIEDPAIINMVSDLFNDLEIKKISFKIIADGFASSRFQNHKELLKVKNISAEEIIEAYTPKLFVFGTSENRESYGFNLINAAKSRDIHSISLVDSWYNYENRFSGKTSDPLHYLTDEIYVTDSKTIELFLGLGVPKDRVKLIQNPIFKKVVDWKKSNKSNPKLITLQANKKNLPVLTFIAEGWDKLNPKNSLKNINYRLFGRGKSKFRTVIVMEELLDSLARTSTEVFKVLRLHPNSNLDDFMPVANEFNSFSIEDDPYQLCISSTYVLGMTSMLLLEAELLGVRTASILPDINEKEWMPNLTLGTTSVLNCREEIDKFWSEKFSYKEKKQVAYEESDTSLVSMIETFLNK